MLPKTNNAPPSLPHLQALSFSAAVFLILPRTVSKAEWSARSNSSPVAGCHICTSCFSSTLQVKEARGGMGDEAGIKLEKA